VRYLRAPRRARPRVTSASRRSSWTRPSRPAPERKPTRMSLSLKVPALGESVREATLGTWKRGEGDHVEADEPLVEVESEKATLEVPSPGAGVLTRILRKAGETVAVGEVIAEIDQVGQAASAPAPQPSPPPQQP